MEYSIDPQKTRVILLGTSKYDYDFNDINQVENNIKDFAEILKNSEYLGIKETDIKIILNKDNVQMEEELDEFVQQAIKDKKTTLIIYFAGHGFKNDKGEFYLIATNSKKSTIQRSGNSALKYETVKKIIDEPEIKQKIILLDACYSGLAEQGNENFEQLVSKATYVITSSDKKEPSFYDTDEKYTMFTGEMLNIIKKGLPINKEKIPINTFFETIQKNIKKKQPKMTPQFVSKGDTSKNLYLFKNKKFDKVAISLKQAEIFFEQGEYEKAIKEYEKIIKYYSRSKNYDKLDEINTRIDKAEEYKKIKEKLYANIKKEIAAKTNELNEQITQLQKKIKSEKEKYQQLLTDKQNIEKQLKEKETELKATAEKDQILYNKLLKEKEKLDQDFSKIKQELSKINKKNTELTQQISQLQKLKTEAEQKLQKQLKIEKEKYQQLLTDKQNIEKQLKEKERKIKEVSAFNEINYNKLLNEKQKIEKEYKEELTKKNTELNHLLEQLKIEKENYKKLLFSKQNIKNQQKIEYSDYDNLKEYDEISIKSPTKKQSLQSEQKNKLIEKNYNNNLKQTTSQIKINRRQNFIERIGSISFEMIYVKGGTFKMGDEYGDLSENSKPVHIVTVKDFFIGKFLVTQKIWKEIMRNNPSYIKDCDDCPVEKISWNDAQEFIKKLNAKTGKNYRLPTEAEWEYAARGGIKSKGYRYSGSDSIDEVAWYGRNSNKRTHPVGRKKANELGIYDMSGNVWEWCLDSWHENYKLAPTDGSIWESYNCPYRIKRGGSCNNNSSYCRIAFRYFYASSNRYDFIGFRLCLNN